MRYIMKKHNVERVADTKVSKENLESLGYKIIKEYDAKGNEVAPVQLKKTSEEKTDEIDALEKEDKSEVKPKKKGTAKSDSEE